MQYYLAIDIGASSGRHIVGWQENGVIHTKEVYRFSNGAQEEGGHLVWNVKALLLSVIAGMKEAFRQFQVIESMSVDTWGVDYVLLRGNEEVFPVFAYRDSRTDTVITRVHEKISFSQLYRRTGCQFQPFNTIYQLYYDKQIGRLNCVTDMLLMPEYLMWKLCGIKAREFTNATTTGIVNAQTGEFDETIIDVLGYPRHLFPILNPPGTVLGSLLPEIAAEVGGNCKVILCATHDTASAVEGIHMDGNYPYISSGTWSLLGVKTPTPITDAGSENANYSNEGGVSYNRYQKNIMGMWIVNELQRELCPILSFSEIERQAEASNCNTLVNTNAPHFFAPASMRAAFDSATNNALKTTDDYFRCAYRSLAMSYDTALRELENNTGKCYSKIYIVGGGAKNAFLNRLTEEATGKQVIALAIEATALGNLKIQMEVN